MNDAYYFLDNNVVSHLTKPQLTSQFFADHCRIPGEVFNEAGRREELRRALYPMTVEVLEALRDVMATLTPDDTSLVDLYANKGNADPVLVACALVETRHVEPFLVKPQWFVVSNDAAVCAKSADVGVEALSREEFFATTASSWGD